VIDQKDSLNRKININGVLGLGMGIFPFCEIGIKIGKAYLSIERHFVLIFGIIVCIVFQYEFMNIGKHSMSLIVDYVRDMSLPTGIDFYKGFGLEYRRNIFTDYFFIIRPSLQLGDNSIYTISTDRHEMCNIIILRVL
jgi:hypothetical protein